VLSSKRVRERVAKNLVEVSQQLNENVPCIHLVNGKAPGSRKHALCVTNRKKNTYNKNPPYMKIDQKIDNNSCE
jgi:hypothetical protein